jgi:hypothetical protein
MLRAVVGRQYVVTEVVARVPPHRMHVVPAALRVVVLDEQVRPLNPVVVPLARRRAARPREREVLRPRRVDPRQLRRRDLVRQPPSECRHQRDERVQLPAVQVGAAHPLRPVPQVAEDRPFRIGDPVVRLRAEDVVRQLRGTDPRHHPGSEVRRRPVPDDRGGTLRAGQRADELTPARLVVRQRRQRPVRGGHAAEHARGGGQVPPAGDGEVQRHVVPRQLPAPRCRAARRPEDPEAVPLGVKQVRDRRRVQQHERPPHVLHRHDGDDLRVPRHADRRRDQPVRELALRVGERSDRQPAPLGLRQVRPLPPRPGKFKIICQNVPLRLIERIAERGRGGGHPRRRLRRQVLLHRAASCCGYRACMYNVTP